MVKSEQLVIRQVYLIICDYIIKPTTDIIINNSNRLLGLLYVHVDFADESPSAGLNSIKKEKFDKIPERLDCCHGPE